MRLRFLLIFISLGTLTFAHPIKLTTGKLTLHTSESVGNLVLNFFIDDFEAEMRKMYPQPPFNFEQPTGEMTLSIQDYIRKNVKIWVDDQVAALTVKGIQKIEENVCQVQLKVQFKNTLEMKVIKVHNSLLFDAFEKQSNMLHLFVDEDPHRILQFYPSRRESVTTR